MIDTTQLAHNTKTSDQVIVRALSAITSKQADRIAGIVQASGQRWDIQTINDYDGYQSILIEPSNVSCYDRKAFFISGTAQRLELSEAHDENLTLIGTFADTEALGARLIALLGTERPVSCRQR